MIRRQLSPHGAIEEILSDGLIARMTFNLGRACHEKHRLASETQHNQIILSICSCMGAGHPCRCSGRSTALRPSIMPARAGVNAAEAG
jgi:hypothetical protein